MYVMYTVAREIETESDKNTNDMHYYTFGMYSLI